MDPVLTDHAFLRMSQRNYNLRDVKYILTYGHVEHQTGIRFYFLGKKCVPTSDLRLPWVQRLIGTTLLLSSDQKVLITLYKNHNGLKEIKRKDKRRFTSQFCLVY